MSDSWPFCYHSDYFMICGRLCRMPECLEVSTKSGNFSCWRTIIRSIKLELEPNPVLILSYTIHISISLSLKFTTLQMFASSVYSMPRFYQPTVLRCFCHRSSGFLFLVSSGKLQVWRCVLRLATRFHITLWSTDVQDSQEAVQDFPSGCCLHFTQDNQPQ